MKDQKHIKTSSSLAEQLYDLPPLQKTSANKSRSFAQQKMPNGYLVSYCDGLAKVPTVKREFKPNPEVVKRLKSLGDFHHSISAQLGTKSYFENIQKQDSRTKPTVKKPKAKVRAEGGFQYWYQEPRNDTKVRSNGAFGSKNTILGIGGGSNHISRQPVNALHFSKPTASLESMIRATAPLQWIGATFQNM